MAIIVFMVTKAIWSRFVNSSGLNHTIKADLKYHSIDFDRPIIFHSTIRFSHD